MRTRHIKRADGKGRKPRERFEPSPFHFDAGNLPELLRLNDIVRDARRGYAGLVPVTRSAWLEAVGAGHIPPPIRLGNKAIAWPKAIVLEVMKNGIPRGRRGPRAEARAKAHAEHRAAEASKKRKKGGQRKSTAAASTKTTKAEADTSPA